MCLFFSQTGQSTGSVNCCSGASHCLWNSLLRQYGPRCTLTSSVVRLYYFSRCIPARFASVNATSSSSMRRCASRNAQASRWCSAAMFETVSFSARFSSRRASFSFCVLLSRARNVGIGEGAAGPHFRPCNMATLIRVINSG